MSQEKIHLTLRSGKGGKGCLSFSSSRKKARGGPDGGDGGRGGDVILKVDLQKNNLSHLKHKGLYVAKSGQAGKSYKQKGKKGEDLVLLVPPNTCLCFNQKSVQIQDSYTLLKGGRGGRGNAFFKNSVNQAPRKIGTGEDGKTQKIELCLDESSQPKIGIFGGSFDPPHKGHLFVAKTALHTLNLDELYIIPSYQTPHKSLSPTKPQARWQMVKDTFQHLPKTKILDVELKRKGSSYTIDTLQSLKIKGRIFLILGEDLFEHISAWKNFYQIIKQANLVVCMRGSRLMMNQENCPLSLRKYIQSYQENIWKLKTNHHIFFLPCHKTLMDVSSTEIKDQIQKGVKLKNITPEIASSISTHYQYLNSKKGKT